jgi:integrase
MEFSAEEWGRKGATLSDKTARSEYGLTQDEIFAAMDAGKPQYRPAAMHGNPWLRLLRREVEDLVRARHGDRSLRERTLWRMAYESAARSAELLALDVEHLDLPGRRAKVRRKGGAIDAIVCRPARPGSCLAC